MVDKERDRDLRYQAPKGMRFCFAKANETGTALFVVWGHFFFTDWRKSVWIVVEGDASKVAADLNEHAGKHKGPGKRREVVLGGRSRAVEPRYSGNQYVTEYEVIERLSSAEREVLLDSKYDSDEVLSVLTMRRERVEAKRAQDAMEKRTEDILAELAAAEGNVLDQ